MLPAAPFFAWFVSLFGTTITTVFTWLTTKFVYERAVQIALVSAFVVTCTGAFLTVSLSIKAAVMAARVTLPPIMATGLMFLPPSLNQIIATIVTIRVARALHRWTVGVIAAYLPQSPNVGLFGRGITS